MISDGIVKQYLEQRHLQLAHELMAELFIRKMGKKGVRLSASQCRRVHKWVLEGCKSRFSLRVPQKGSITLDITPREQRRVFGLMRKRALNESQRAITSMLHIAPPKLYRQFKKNWPAQARWEERQIEAFEARLRRKWALPIKLLSMLLSLAKEMGSDVNEEARAQMKPGNVHQVEAVTRLHGRACQIATEIIVLLRSGYADGAMARWRSLHEIAVVLLFLDKHGEKIARCYLEHGAIESHKAAVDYDLYAERLSHAPLTTEDWAILNRDRAALIKRYGKSFGGEYGWAASILNHPQPRFREIEKAVELSHWRPDYKLASHNVHANPKGIQFRLGLNGDDIVLAGPSDYGLTEPGQNTAISLMQATSVVMQLAPTLDRLCTITAMCKLTDDIEHAFANVGSRMSAVQ